MKGIVFNLLEEIVRREYGEVTWDELIETVQLDGAYTSPGSHPDEDLMKLIEAASSAFNTPPNLIIRWPGRNALPLFAQRYPRFLEGHKSTRSFLLTLNSIIHPEVLKIYPGADVPVFDYDTSSPEVLVMGYPSARKFYEFAEGLIEGAGVYYGEEITFEQPMCMNRGDEKCVLKIGFQKREI